MSALKARLASTQPRSVRKRGLFWILLIVLVLIIGLLTIILSPAASMSALSPTNSSPRGAQAVARVLQQNGVAVKPSETLATAREALRATDGRATLLLHDPDGILDADQLKELAATAPRTVLVEPSAETLKAFAPKITESLRDAEAASATAGCQLSLAQAAPVLATSGRHYRAPLGCYSSPGVDGFAVAFDGTVTVLGSAEYLANRGIRGQGRSAVALWALGQEPTLIWYQPSSSDLSANAETSNPYLLLPAWFGPVMAWAMLMGLLAMFWRGRRLGPLVPEKLPVIVPAAELVDGRARLYAHGRSVNAVTANLRSAALTRMAHHYRLGTGASVQQILAAVQNTGARTAAELELLLNPVPSTEQHLVQWANDLAQLEKEIGSL